MTALVLFIANFGVVALLGLQQINVERRSMIAAACTSPWITIAYLLQFKVLPGPTTWVDIGALIAGGVSGIVASMWGHPRLVRLLERRAPAHTGADESEWDRLAEMQRLATEMADEQAQGDITSFCSVHTMGRLTWYDTAAVSPAGGVEWNAVRRAARYLDLRGPLVRHPVQRSLVRFAA